MVRLSKAYVRESTSEAYVSQRYRMFFDSQVFIPDAVGDFAAVLPSIAAVQVRTSVVLLRRTEWNSSTEKIVRGALDSLRKNAFFFLMVESANNEILWFYALTVPNGYVLSPLEFQPDRLLMKENYNLQGLKVRSVTGDWAPFYTFEGCDETGTRCEKHIGIIERKCFLNRMFFLAG